MKETQFIWYNGEIIKWDEAKTHVMSHILHYGSGVFEGIRCYKLNDCSIIFRLDDHIKRLYNSAELYKLKIPFKMEQIIEGCKDTVQKNNFEECYIRPIAFYGHDTLGVHPKQCPVQVSIATLDWGAYISKEALSKGARITISPWKKFQFSSFPSSIKATGQYLNSLLAVRDAKSKGFDEALLLNIDGSIAEGSGQNIFIIKDGAFHTNDLKSNILMGITRETLFTLINDMNLKYKIDIITQEDLFNAEEVFYCGSASEITPIREIDSHIVGNGSAGPLTLKLQELYYDTVRGKYEKYYNWLSFID